MRRGLVLGLGGLLCAGLCGTQLGTPPAAASAAGAPLTASLTASLTGPLTSAPGAEADLSAAGCDRGSAKNDRTAADRLLAGWLDVPAFPPVKIGTGPHIDWSLDPYGHPSWLARFRDLTWVQPLLRRADASTAYRQRAAVILRDFLAQNPLPPAGDPGPVWSPTLTAKRAETLLCAAGVLGNAPWLTAGLTEHGTVLAQRWSGVWNRGAMEIRALLALGCVTGNEGWVDVAHTRVEESLRDAAPGPVIGADGSTNEQALGYAATVYWLWRQIGHDLAACGQNVPAALDERLPLLMRFLADGTMPNGHLVPLGDTYATDVPPRAKGSVGQFAATLGEKGTRPDHLVGVYAGGYVFGRSGWGTDRPFGSESFYSLRFGPGRQFHGHNDHQALTWYAGGRPLLVDAGHEGYLAGPYREYLQSARAHNVVLPADGVLDAAAATTLERQRIGGAAQYFELTDSAIGATRTRDVLFLQRPDAIVVLDRVRGAPPGRYDQLWHLAPELTVADAGPSAMSAFAPDGAGLTVLQIPFSLLPPASSTSVIAGQDDPLQGWVSGRLGERRAAPVVAFSQAGPDPTFLTVLVSADRDTPVRAEFTGVPLLGGVLTISRGPSSVRIYVGPDGTLARLHDSKAATRRR